MAYYLSMQNVHHKKLFNSNDPLVYEETLRASLKDLSDYHTLSVLRGSGVDHIITHGVSEETISKVDGLKIVHIEPQAPFNILAFTPLVKMILLLLPKLLPSLRNI